MALDVEISPEQLEEELRAGAPVTIVDTRTPDDFGRWHLDPAQASLVNVPLEELTESPEVALAQIPAEGPVRVICGAGRSSIETTRLLRESGFDAVGIRGGMIAWGSLLRADEVAIDSPTRVIQFRRESRGCLSYLLLSAGEALVVDPAPAVAPYLDAVEAEHAAITRVFDTHVHADHPSGARALAEAADAQLHLPAASITRGVTYTNEIEPIADSESIPLGSARICALALPGHTTDMTGLLIDDRALVAGDSLFADSIARPDLEAGDDGAATAARTLWQTLQERVRPLDSEVVLLPCHYPGGRLDGPIAPTLGDVHDSVRLLGLGREEFVAELLSDMPPRPANFLEIIAVNMGEERPDVASLEAGGNSCAADANWAR